MILCDGCVVVLRRCARVLVGSARIVVQLTLRRGVCGGDDTGCGATLLLDLRLAGARHDLQLHSRDQWVNHSSMARRAKLLGLSVVAIQRLPLVGIVTTAAMIRSYEVRALPRMAAPSS